MHLVIARYHPSQRNQMKLIKIYKVLTPTITLTIRSLLMYQYHKPNKEDVLKRGCEYGRVIIKPMG